MFGERVKELVERYLASNPKILERVVRLLTGEEGWSARAGK